VLSNVPWSKNALSPFGDGAFFILGRSGTRSLFR